MLPYKDVLKRRLAWILAVLVLLLSSTATIAAPPANFALEDVLVNIEQPLTMRFFPDGRMLLGQKHGRMKIVDVQSTPAQSVQYMFLGAPGHPDGIERFQERGLIDLAIDPDFPNEPYIYILYTPKTGTDDRLRVSRFTHNENGGGLTSRGDPLSEVILWEDTDGYTSCCHYGGSVNFGPEGRLWITTGDHFEGTFASSLARAGGKVHRINKDGSIPADNPIADGAGPNVDSAVARGLRNPFRARWDFDFLPGRARLFIAEVGGNEQSIAWEDLHVLDYDYASGRFVDNDFGTAGDDNELDLINFGWPTVEGLPPHTNFSSPVIDAVGEPVFAYEHGGALSSITGGLVYRGSQFPAEFDGAYFYSESTRTFVRYIKFKADGTVDPNPNPDPISEDNPDSMSYMFDPDPVGRVVAMDVGPDGALYYLSLTDGALRNVPTVKGAVRRYVYDGGNARPQIASFTADPTSGAAPLTVDFEFSATDPEGDAMTYVVDFGDGNSTASVSLPAGTPTTVSHQFVSDGTYTVQLAVSDGSRTATSTVMVEVGTPPVIDSFTSSNDRPGSAPNFFQFGDTITFSATATDAEDGPVPAANFEWSVDFVRPGTTHPAFSATGVDTIDFDIPAQGQGFSGPVFYRATLKVSDSSGLSTIQTLDVFPEKVDIDFDTVPSGIVVQVDGNTAKETPFVLDTLINIHHTIAVPATTCFNGTQYEFVDWSDGSSVISTDPVIENPQYIVPDSDVALTATFASLGDCAGPPTDGLVMHLRSTDGLVVSGGDQVSSWIDQSGFGNDLVAIGAPTVLPAELNGLEVVHFDGADDALGRTGVVGLPTGAGARSVFMVARYNTADASDPGWAGFTFGDDLANRAFGLVLTPEGNLGVQGWGSNNDFGSSPPANGVGAWLSQSAIYQNGMLSQYKDGAQIGNDAHNFATAADRIRLGEELDFAKNMDMDVAEVLVYDRAVSEAERTTIEDYFEQRYALSTGGIAAPDVDISSPSHNQIIDPTAMPILLEATANDPVDGDLSDDLSWVSSIDGALGTGASISVTLSQGVTHVISASVEAPTSGITGAAEVHVDVLAGNTPPEVDIVSPPRGATFTVGETITFTGTAVDAEEGNLASALKWKSDIDGVLFTGASSSVSSLSVGTHKINASVRDSAGSGLRGADTIRVIVEPVGGNQPADITLTVGVTDNGAYGHNYGSNQHLEALVAAFDGTGSDLEFSVTGFDIDHADEVGVYVNGLFVGFLSVGPNNGLNGGDTFVVPGNLQVAGENRIVLRQVRNLGYKWGVTDLLLANYSGPAGAADVNLAIGVADNGAYGHNFGSGAHVEELVVAFDGTGSDLEFRVDGYDIDHDDEVAVYLNGIPLGFLSVGPDKGLNAGDTFVIPAGMQVTGENRIVIRQVRNVGFTWGVSGLLLDGFAAPSGSADITLTIGTEDGGAYGQNYGSNDHAAELVAAFDGGAQDLQFSLTGYDIDHVDEAAVFLNGSLLGYLSVGPNNGLNAGDTFIIPTGLQVSGENRIVVRQVRRVGYTWGVTDLLIEEYVPLP